MLQLSITHKDLSENEKIALEKLSNYINNEFNRSLIAEHDTEDSEHKYLYQIHNKETYNSRGAGRSANIDKELICEFALTNPSYNMVQIAEYFGCTKQYVSKVLNETNAIIKYKTLRKSITQ